MNIYERPTPRTDEIADRSLLKMGYMEMIGDLAELSRRLEQELDTVRDAHMANCLASDTLRREIAELRDKLSMNSGRE